MKGLLFGLLVLAASGAGLYAIGWHEVYGAWPTYHEARGAIVAAYEDTREDWERR